MGIESLYSSWIKNSNYSDIHLKRISNVFSLLLDFNAIIHEVAQQIYSYGNYKDEKRLKEIESLSDEKLEKELFDTIGKTIINLLQKFNPSNTLVICVDGVAPPAKINQQRSRRYKASLESQSRFNAVCITPGTDFMVRLDNYLNEWIKTNRDLLPNQVIYSSHLIPGEGEHKIFKLFKDNIITSPNSLKHILYGMDADLIMLSLLSNVNIILFRDDNNIINIKSLRNNIINDMIGDLKLDQQRVIIDFITIAFILGNDFIPRLVSIYNVGEAIKLSINIYKKIISESDGNMLVNENGMINWIFLNNFFIQLSEYESTFLIEKEKTPKMHEFKILTDNIKNGKLDFKQFRLMWYSKVINNFNEDDIMKMCSWYLYGFQWILSYYLDKTNSVIFEYIYPYLYSPLISDISFVLYNLAVNNIPLPLVIPIKPIHLKYYHQLVAVIPPKSIKYIPEQLRHLVMKGGSLEYMCPTQFKIDLEGKTEEWQGIPLLPILDINKVIEKVDEIYKDEYKEINILILNKSDKIMLPKIKIIRKR